MNALINNFVGIEMVEKMKLAILIMHYLTAISAGAVANKNANTRQNMGPLSKFYLVPKIIPPKISTLN